MKRFFQKFMLIAASAILLRFIFSPAILTPAGTALRRLGANEHFASAIFGSSTVSDAAVVSGESAEIIPSPTPLQNLLLQTDAAQAGLFHSRTDEDPLQLPLLLLQLLPHQCVQPYPDLQS